MQCKQSDLAIHARTTLAKLIRKQTYTNEEKPKVIVEGCPFEDALIYKKFLQADQRSKL